MRAIPSGLTLLALLLASFGVQASTHTMLLANFDDKTPGQALGIGGAALGEPVNLQLLDTLVVADSPGQNHVLVSNDLTATGARRLHWDLLNVAELTRGKVTIAFEFTPSSRDAFSMVIRENGSSTSSFMAIAFGSNGTLIANDANGVYFLPLFTYTAGITQAIELQFDMDARTSSITINGVILSEDRAHGVTTGRGIGSIYIGYGSGSSGSAFELDNLVVTHETALRAVLDANLDDKTVGDPIGTGGASVGEPIEVDAELTNEIVSTGAGDQALRLASTTTQTAAAMRWEFLNNIEIPTGRVVLEWDSRFASIDNHSFIVRETGGAQFSFGNLDFVSTGQVVLSDATGFLFVPDFLYVADQTYNIRLDYDLDAGSYDFYIDDVLLVGDRPHGVTSGRGIGAWFPLVPNNASNGGIMTVDNIRVSANDAEIIPVGVAFLGLPLTGMPNTAVTPAVEVGVLNTFDEVIPDDTLVTLDIESGPAGAVLSSGSALTVGGSAQFPMLTLNLPGNYVLRASSGDASVIAAETLVIGMVPDFVFGNGFEAD